MKKLFFLIMIAVMFTVMFVQSGTAQTYVNSSTGNDATGDGSSGSPYKTFHKGYTMVASGGTINLTGTFTWTDADETGDLANTGYTIAKNLTIQGQDPLNTIIQAKSTYNTADRRVFTISNTYTVTFRNLKIRHGVALTNYKGGAIGSTYAQGGSVALNLYNVNISENSGYFKGPAGVYCEGSFTADRCTFENNYMDANTEFPRIALELEMASGSYTRWLKNCTFYNNTTVGTYASYGSTIFIDRSGVNIMNCTFLNNHYTFCSYAMSPNSSETRLTNCIIANSTGYDIYADRGNANGIIVVNSIVEVQKAGSTAISYTNCLTGEQPNLNITTPTTNGGNNLITPYLELTTGSVAINAGTTGTFGGTASGGSLTVPSIDQRGFTRSGTYDIGSYEYGYVWKGTTSNDFNTASNWIDGVVPPTGAIIVFDPNPVRDCILDQNRTIADIINSQSTYKLDVNGKQLTINGNVQLSNNAKIKADATNSTLIFAGTTAQTLSASSLENNSAYNLTLNNALGLTTNTDITIANTLTLTNGLLTLGSSNLTIGNVATISGTPSATNMIVATSTGQLIKTFTGTGSFVYPVGDNTGTAEYSPITLNFTSGTFSAASAGVLLSNSKYGSNSSASHYLNRYWTVTQSGISSFSCNVTAQYLPADVVGTESNIWTGKYSSGTWIGLNQADAVNHRLSGTVTGFSTFTGGEQSIMPVSLSSFTSNVAGQNINLKWITSSEQNNSGFNVERKTTETEWSKIGFVAGNGTINTQTSYTFTDTKLNTGKYQYRLKQIDNNGNFEYHSLSGEVEVGVPAKFELSQNYPNPFNPTTKIDYQLPLDSKVSLKIFDITGREVMSVLNNESRTAGYYTLNINASALSSGVYFYKVVADKYTQVKKMVVMK